MAKIAESNELDIISKYKSLMAASMDGSSSYIRAKETLEQMYVDNDVPQDQKGEVLAGLLSALHTAAMTTSMSTAIQWAAKEKDLALQKLELELQLDVLKNEVDKSANEADRIRQANLTAQADSLRANGAMTVVEGTVTSLSDSGTQYENILLTKEKVESENKAQLLSDAKLKETNAGTHKIVADTYVNYGMYSGYNITDTGVTGVTDATPAGYYTLSDMQRTIAQEQAKGYAYNAWSNAASGLGSTIGVALTSETDIFTGDNAGILTAWKATVDNLKNAVVPTF